MHRQYFDVKRHGKSNWETALTDQLFWTAAIYKQCVEIQAEAARRRESSSVCVCGKMKLYEAKEKPNHSSQIIRLNWYSISVRYTESSHLWQRLLCCRRRCWVTYIHSTVTHPHTAARMIFYETLLFIFRAPSCCCPATWARDESGSLTADENPAWHFLIFFLLQTKSL